MASPKLIQVAASVIGMNPRADRSWRISFETAELNGDEVSILADNFQGEGWLVYKPNSEVQVADIPEGYADPGVKSPAQRLRAKIFILWKQKGSKGDYESYYRTSIERLITIIDEQLEQLSEKETE